MQISILFPREKDEENGLIHSLIFHPKVRNADKKSTENLKFSFRTFSVLNSTLVRNCHCGSSITDM